MDQSLPKTAGQKEPPFLGCKFAPRALLPAELSFWSPSRSLEGRVPQTKGGIYFLAPTRWPLLRCLGTCLRNSDPPEPGTTFMGSELIMSFYELWGPRGTRINVKRAHQPRSLGECHTLTKLKAAATSGRSCRLHVRQHGPGLSIIKLLSRLCTPEPEAVSRLRWNSALLQPERRLVYYQSARKGKIQH